MEWGLQELLIICPLVFLAGFVDAVAGGGGLISLPAYMIAGFPVHYSIATNKLSSGMGTALTTARFALKGYIPWRTAAFSVVCALIGASLGARTALMLSDRVFKMIMLVVLPLTALYVLRGHALSTGKEPYGRVRTTLLSMAIALALGLYDGFYGPGAGTFMLLLLTAGAHLSLAQANGTTKAINLTTNLTALTVFWLNGRVLVPLGLTAGLFGMAGNYMGTRFFEKDGSRAVRPIMLVVLTVFFIRVLSELL